MKGGDKMFKKQIKKMKMLDFALVKLGVAAFVLFVLRIWPAARSGVMEVNPWCFIGIAVIAVAIVQFRIWRK
jgi:hypothetical protein